MEIGLAQTRMPKKSKKAEELKARPPPLRGDAAKPKIDAMHAEAEMRHALQIQVKQGAAARQNAKAEMVVADNKKKQRRVLQERKENHEMEMAAHVQRHDGIVKERSAKGLAEVEKVKEAVASLHQAEADTIAQGARAQDEYLS